MLNFIDNFLNKITMYRLVLYVLTLFVLVGLIFSFLNILAFNPLNLLAEIIFILLICYITNETFAKVFKVPANIESIYITAFILVLIVNPPGSLSDTTYWWFLFWASLWAMAGKYIVAIKKKHIFNPAAFALVLTGFTLHQGAGWWIGTLSMLPFVLAGGLLIVRKIQRFDLFISFIIVSLTTLILMRGDSTAGALNTLRQLVLYSPLLFFATIMLTEPLTTPPTRFHRIIYGGLVGFLFSPFVHIGSIYSTPELALIVGNLFSYIISPKQKLVLTLKEKIKVAEFTYDFVFSPSEKLKFKAGQYLEWTLGHKNPDSRGNRRYFTIASAPSSTDIRLGVRFYPNGSSYKNNLLAMTPGASLSAGALAGEFTLPKDPTQKLVFLAGGIGITPFRSMVQEISNLKEKRDMVLLYSNRTQTDIAYKEFLDTLAPSIGLRNVYTLSDEPPDTNWSGKRGMIDANFLKNEVPDYKERYFYISGTHGMVTAFERMLKGLGIPKSRIKTDFFPGYV